IEFYKRALGARELMRMASPDGNIAHAELKIGDSIIFLSDEFPNMGSKSPQTLGSNTGNLYVYVEDVDTAFNGPLMPVGGQPCLWRTCSGATDMGCSLIPMAIPGASVHTKKTSASKRRKSGQRTSTHRWHKGSRLSGRCIHE